MAAVADIFTVLAVIAGCVLFMAGTVGLLRFPDELSRLHALTKVDNLGLGLIVAGLIPAGRPSGRMAEARRSLADRPVVRRNRDADHSARGAGRGA